MNDFEITLIYTTADTKNNAEVISNHLIENKLIACSNVFPISSFFKFHGNLSNESEYAILCKTLNSLKDNVINEIQKIHKYSIPCIIQIPCNVNEEYFQWMKQNIS